MSYNQQIVYQTSTFGFSPNGASLLAYIWIPVTSIIVIVTEKENRLVRFHAFQSLFLGLSLFSLTLVLSVVIGILTLVGGAISPYLGLIISVISLILWIVIALAILGLWALCLLNAYKGKMYMLPVIGKLAEKQANK